MTLRRIDVFLFRAAIALFIMLLLVAGAMAWNGPKIVAGMAEYVVGHSAQPKGTVYPPTPFLPMQSTAEVAALGGRAEGISCSLPSIAESFFDDAPEGAEQAAPNASVNLQFRQACFRHDYCYRHGAATYGYTQLECDNFLAEDAARLCVQIMARADSEKVPQSEEVTQKRLAWCQTRARKVLLGVMTGGAAAFREVQPNHRYQVKDPSLYDLQSEVSTRLEYDPYPSVKSDGEHFALRLVEQFGACGGPALVTYRRQSAGQIYSFRCIFADATGTTPVYSLGDPYHHPPTTAETNRIVGTPWLTQSGIDEKAKPTFALSQWCRDFRGSDTPITGGFFTSFAPEKKLETEQSEVGKDKAAKSAPKYSPNWALPCNRNWATILAGKPTHFNAARSVAVEADSITYFPMPVAQNFGVDAVFQNIVWDGGQPECTAWAVPRDSLQKGLGKADSVKLTTPAHKKAFPNYHTLLQRDTKTKQGQSTDCYRWFATAPQFVVAADRQSMNMLFFRRGNADGAGYADTLDVMMRGYSTKGFTGDPTYARLNLNEMQEPFIALPYQNGAALLSIARDDLAVKGLVTLWFLVRLIGAILLILAVYFMARADFGLTVADPVVPEDVLSKPLTGKFFGSQEEFAKWAMSHWRRYRPGMGFAALVLVGSFVWIGIGASNRDDVSRASKLGTAVTLSVFPIADGGKTVRFHWDQISPSGQHPARFMQNRMSVVNDGTGGHYLIAPRIAEVPKEPKEGCAISVELAVIHLTPDAHQASVRIVEREILFKVKTPTQCEPAFYSFPAQMTVLPFRYPAPAKDGSAAAVSALILHAQEQGKNSFIPDIAALPGPVLHLNPTE